MSRRNRVKPWPTVLLSNEPEKKYTIIFFYWYVLGLWKSEITKGQLKTIAIEILNLKSYYLFNMLPFPSPPINKIQSYFKKALTPVILSVDWNCWDLACLKIFYPVNSLWTYRYIGREKVKMLQSYMHIITKIIEKTFLANS